MSSKRSHALNQIRALMDEVESHLAMLRASPNDRSANHWRSEVRGWLRTMERHVDDLGRRTRVEWAARIAGWWDQLGRLT